MGYGEIAAFQIMGKVDMAQAGVISESAAREDSERLLNNLNDADRQEALTILAEQARRI